MLTNIIITNALIGSFYSWAAKNGCHGPGLSYKDRIRNFVLPFFCNIAHAT